MTLVLDICAAALIASVLLGLLRMVRGPSAVDRILAFDGIAISVMGLIIVLGIRWDTAFFVELFIIFSLLGFLGTVAFVFYLQKTMSTRDDDDE